MDANSIRLSRPTWWETVFTLVVCTKQLFFFQVFVRETRTPAFICLQKDRDRQISVFSKKFFVTPDNRCLVGAPRFPILYHPRMRDWLQQWRSIKTHSGFILYSSRSRGDHIGRNETDQWKASFQMPSNRQTTIAKAVPKNRNMSSEQLRLSTRIA
jgi:hypothetical protein